MSIPCREAVAMVDFDHTAIAALPAGADDDARSCRTGRRANRRPEVDARMQRKRADQGIFAHAKAAGDWLSGCGIGNGVSPCLVFEGIELVEGLVEFLDLGIECGCRIEGNQGAAD